MFFLTFLLLSTFLKCRVIAGELQSEKPMSVVELQKYLEEVFPFQEQSRRCPAPILPVFKEACQSSSCIKDADCSVNSTNFACCFNGCRHTCLEKLALPAVIDWEVESLTNGLLHNTPLVTCTTTFRHPPTVPLGCAVGFFCEIQDPGDHINGVPNKGICLPELPQNDEKQEETSAFSEKKGTESVFLPGGCLLTKEQYLNIQDFLHRTYVINCTCIKGSVECQLSPHRKG